MAANSSDTYQVVVNDHEQYSVWSIDREVPLGWRAIGKQGTKAECDAYVEQQQAENNAQGARVAGQFGEAGE